MPARLPLAFFALLVAGCAGRGAVPQNGSPALLSADDTRALAVAYREAARSYFGGDLAGATRGFSRAQELNPGADSLVYTLGAIAAEAGRHDEAHAWLDRLVALRSDLVPLERDFPGLGGERFDQVVAALARNGPQQHAEVAFTLAERDLIPEGIAHDPQTGTFFVSSIRKRKVVALRAGGAVTDFVAARAHGMLGAVGMKADPARRQLWVGTFAAASMEGFTPEDRGRAILFRFDVDSGELLARYPRQTPGAHLLNDVAFDAKGNLYVTDSEAGEVLKLAADAPEGDSFEVVVPAGELVYPNGIALMGVHALIDFSVA